ncbi:hypothetical protein SASPL_157086 [Salvia splendens]|uniref:RNase H type-1 domain-containing protein n=1 Tax=Salvia splendens TaxID=180675 RepID=A0A8X8VVH7_SALSN|nr:hypothetical protein SASPL_157086 [Salvia splendens]
MLSFPVMELVSWSDSYFVTMSECVEPFFNLVQSKKSTYLTQGLEPLKHLIAVLVLALYIPSTTLDLDNALLGIEDLREHIHSLMDLMDSKKMEVTYCADVVWRYVTRQVGHAHLQHVILRDLVGDGQRDRNLNQGGSFVVTFTDAEFPSDSITNEGAEIDYSVKTGLELPHQEKEGEDSVAAELERGMRSEHEDESIPTCLQTGSALEHQFTLVPFLDLDRWAIPLVVIAGILLLYWRCCGRRKHGINLQQKKVKDFWRNGCWNVALIQSVLEPLGEPREVTEEIAMIPIDSGIKDKLRWMKSPHGDFTTNSAWEIIRFRHPVIQVFKLIWNECILPSISIFVWRCCRAPAIETREHLFIHGEVAAQVGEKIADWFPTLSRRNVSHNDLEKHIKFWHRWLCRTPKPHVSSVIPCLALWTIWSERNGRIHRGDVVYRRISDKPGVGGILRDEEGNLVRGFKSNISAVSHLDAELQALSLGLDLVGGGGRKIWIEMGNLEAVALLKAEKHGAANLRHKISEIRNKLKSICYKISHIQKEGNKAANTLAHQRGKEGRYIIFDQHTAAPLVKAMIRMDQLGLPNFPSHGPTSDV